MILSHVGSALKNLFRSLLKEETASVLLIEMISVSKKKKKKRGIAADTAKLAEVCCDLTSYFSIHRAK